MLQTYRPRGCREDNTRESVSYIILNGAICAALRRVKITEITLIIILKQASRVLIGCETQKNIWKLLIYNSKPWTDMTK